jgi:hypothetical protein
MVKIYEAKQRPFKTDRELVYNYQNAKTIEEWKEAAYELWSKYIRVVSIGKKELSDLCKRHNFKMYDVIEEYESIFWEKFLNQLYGIKLERVAHIPNWSMYIRVLGYLKSMNRDQIRAYIKWHDHNEPILETWENDGTIVSNIDKHSSTQPNEIEYLFNKNLNQKIFWESIDKLKLILTDSQKKMLNLKIKNYSNYDIQTEIKISPDHFKKDLQVIKLKFGEIVSDVAKNNGIKNYDYQKLCEALQ